MKNLFALSKKEDKSRIKPFIIRELSKNDLNKTEEEVNKYDSKRKKIYWIEWFMFIPSVFGVGIVLGCIRGGMDKVIKNYLWLLLIGIGLILITAIYFAIKHLKRDINNGSDPEMDNIISKLDNLRDNNLNSLDVPASAIKIDILYSKVKYDKKNDIDKLKKIKTFHGVNYDKSIFIEGYNLCICDDVVVIGIPLEDIIRFERIDKKLIIPYWNKRDKLDNVKFLDYVYYAPNIGICVNYYYRLIFRHNKEEYYIIIFNYDYDDVYKLIKKKVDLIN